MGPLILSLHVTLPLQAPDQPANAEPLAAFALRVTDFPNANACEHFFGHLMPAGELAIFPEPFPDLRTLSANGLV